jgi:hypothetical protein
MTLQGRLKLTTRIGEYQHKRFDRVKGQCDLVHRKGVFYLIVVVDAAEKSQYDPVGTLGVDLGIENIAVDSDGRISQGKQVNDPKWQRICQFPSSVLQKAGATTPDLRGVPTSCTRMSCVDICDSTNQVMCNFSQDQLSPCNCAGGVGGGGGGFLRQLQKLSN